jgi:hypothetical protein
LLQAPLRWLASRVAVVIEAALRALAAKGVTMIFPVGRVGIRFLFCSALLVSYFTFIIISNDDCKDIDLNAYK